MIKGHWQLLVLSALIFALWHTPIVTPLKILIVFLHELSHAAAAYFTGGSILDISVSPDQGGSTTTRGGNRFVTLTAGYLGSLLIGIGVLVVALRTNLDRAALGFSGALMLFVVLLYIRDTFALAFCIATGLAMIAAARFLPLAGCDLILRIIGLTSAIYVPYDIYDDTIARSGLRSDARMLAEEIGGGTMLWGGLWLVISIGAILACVRYGLGQNSNLTLPRAPSDT